MSKSKAAGLAIRLLGDFNALVRGRAVEDAQWARPQAKLLVKLLALDPRHQLHRQQLIDIIWPDLDPESGAANLHKICSPRIAMPTGARRKEVNFERFTNGS